MRRVDKRPLTFNMYNFAQELHPSSSTAAAYIESSRVMVRVQFRSVDSRAAQITQSNITRTSYIILAS